MNKIRKNSRKGAALVLVFAALLILLIWGIGYFSLGLNSRIFAIRNASTITARTAADSGLARALYEMNKLMFGAGGSLGIPTDYHSGPISGQWESDPTVTYTWQIDANGPSGNRWFIYDVTSTGTAKEVSRKVSGIINLSSALDYAILTDTSITLNNNNFVGYNSAVPQLDFLKIATNGVDDVPPPVTMGNNTIVDGDIMVAPGVGPPLATGGTINGQVYNVTEPFPMPTVTEPTGLTSLPAIKESYIVPPTGSGGKYLIPSINLNGNSDTLTINGDVTIYVQGGITFAKAKEELIINANSSLKIYAGGTIDMQNKITLNGELDPARLQIYGLPTCTSIELKNNSDVRAVVVAPHAAVYTKNNGNFYGAVISKTFENKNNTTFYYDPSLRSKIIVPGTKFVIRRFWEN